MAEGRKVTEKEILDKIMGSTLDELMQNDTSGCEDTEMVGAIKEALHAGLETKQKQTGPLYAAQYTHALIEMVAEHEFAHEWNLAKQVGIAMD